MGRMKERYIEQLREEEVKQHTYPDQYEMMNNEQCINCLGFSTITLEVHTIICDDCGVTMIKIDDQLRLA